MIRAKFVAADSHDAALAAAAAYFTCTTEELTIDIINESDDNSPIEILAIHGSQEEVRNMKPFYKIFFETDGVFLELYARRESVIEFDNTNLINYLGRKKIINLSMDQVHKLIENGAGRAKIAIAQTEYFFGEDLHISIDGDELKAYIRLLEPEPKGLELKLDEARQKLVEAGVVYGVDDAALIGLLQAKIYNEPRVIAEATLPVDGEDGKLIFHFSLDEKTGAPKEISGGRVDYYSLDLYVPVEEGQLLVSGTFATEGTPGTSVRGTIINQRKGREVALPRAKNVTVNNEKKEMTANCPGLVEFISNVITVSNVYKINGDVDISVGNIDFDGNVQITGTVRSGHTVKATGGISVGGGVEAATLTSGGSVEIKGGLQGAGRGKVEAAGAVTAMFAERGIIIADGPVKVDVCIHSTVETSGNLHALGKRGAVIGGNTAVGGDLIANYIGALSGVRTNIEVGVVPRKRARVQTLEQEIERIDNDRIKLNQLDAYLEKSKGKIPQETWEKLHLSGIENRRINEENYAAYTNEIKNLKYEIAHATKSKVHVFDTTFSGVQISIGSSMYKVTDEVIFATYKYSDGEVVCRSCEITQKDVK